MSNNGFAIPIFLSHSSEDKLIAGEIKKTLEPFGIDVFLAHDDIEAGEDWKTILHSEIKKCKIFLVLLSKNYHKANYTDQEFGMALAYKKPVIPISIDETLPYGFMEKFQCMKFGLEITEENIKKLMDLIMNSSSTEKELLDLLIEKLSNAISFNNAAFWANKLSLYSKFTKNQINQIAKALINNNQVSESFRARPKIMHILKNNQKLIDINLKNHIQF